MSTEAARPREVDGILVDAWRLPVTSLTCVTAIVLSFLGWSSVGLEPFRLDGRAFHGEPWRLLSANFVHSGGFHLLFNLAWTWTFGRLLEPRLGHVGFLALVVFVALGVSLTCHAFDQGGIGLSGIGYGLWSFLALGGRRSPVLHGLLDRRTNLLFVVWFFFCIAVTVADVWAISNWGHGAGAALGAIVALVIEPDLRLKPARWAALGCLLLALLGCATLLRERVNFGAGAKVDAYEGYAALVREDWESARSHLSSAVRIDPDDAGSWWNLAVTHAQLGDRRAAVDAGFRSFELDGAVEDQEWLAREMAVVTVEESNSGRLESALAYACNAVKVAPDSAPLWENVRLMAERAGNAEWVERANAELARLPPLPH